MLGRLRGLIVAPGAFGPVRRATIVGAAILAFAIDGLQPASGRVATMGAVGVSATVVDSCRFVEIPDAVLSTASASWAVQFQCTRTTPYRLEVGAGLHFDAGQGSRRMRSEQASGGVAYSLVATRFAGEGAGAQFTAATFAATVAPSDFARAAAGAYTDTVVLTLRHAINGRVLGIAPLRVELRTGGSTPR